MASDSTARSQYLALLAAADRPGDQLELAAALARAAWSRLTRGRGALHVRRPVTLRHEGVRYRVPPFDNSFVSASPGEANGPVVRELIALLTTRPQRWVLDIGANIGFVSLTLAQRFRERRVLSVEPIPWLAEALRESARLNGFDHMQVAHCALADASELALQVPRLDGVWFTTLSSGAEHASAEALRVPRERVVVPAMTLDALCVREGISAQDIACVKIDVEGAESWVLATGERSLVARPPVVFEALTPAHLADVRAVLERLGYAALRPLDRTNFVATAH